MKKVLIIYNGFSFIEQTKYKINRLVEELNKFNTPYEVKSSLDIITNTKIDSNIKEEYLFVLNLDKDYYLAKLLSSYIHVYNSPESMQICDDKMTTLLYLNKENINIPKTISAPLNYLDKLDINQANIFLTKVKQELSFPIIFKLNHGSLGMQVKLINNEKELLDIYKKNYNQSHLYEEFYYLHKGSDYRVLVINNKVEAVMNRINSNDFRSNIYLGGKGIDVTKNIDKRIKEIAIKACKILKLDYAGVDVMYDNNNIPAIIEVNSNPFFGEIEKVTNINISNKLISYLININKN